MSTDVDQKYVTVGGAEMPAVGLGVWRAQGRECYRAVSTALETGYRLLDTAEAYDNERQVGAAVADSDVDREEVFLTTKVIPTRLDYDAVRSAAEGSLRRLGVDYVDLLLIHWPNPVADLQGQLRALADLREESLIRHLGVSNFGERRLRKARELSPAPILTDQVQFHPFFTQRPLLRYCQDNDVVMTGYSPLGHGGILDDDLLNRVGERYGKSPAQVAVRWAIQHRNVVTIPKSTTPEHIEENFDVFDFSLSETEMDRIARQSYLRTTAAWLRARAGI